MCRHGCPLLRPLFAFEELSPGNFLPTNEHGSENQSRGDLFFHSFELFQVLPLSIVFVAMIAFNNLCLKYVGVSFYYVGRSLTTVFNVVSQKHFPVYFFPGLFLCDSGSIHVHAGSGMLFSDHFWIFPWSRSRRCRWFTVRIWYDVFFLISQFVGVIYGVLASLCVALNAIYTKRSLGAVGDSIWRLTMYNNLNAVFLFLPLMLFR